VFPKEGVIGKGVGDWVPRLDWNHVEVLEDTYDPQRFGKTPNWSALLRMVRNSLAHSSVAVEDKRFVFTDSWDFLGELTMESYSAANQVLYSD
jgi:hypothetical protein